MLPRRLRPRFRRPLPPLSTHALVEFGNRAVSGVVGVITVIAAVLALTRRPFRRDLAWLAVLLPLGVVAQAVLGGFTVLHHLAPGFVMAHFSLSLLILVAAFALDRADVTPAVEPEQELEQGVVANTAQGAERPADRGNAAPAINALTSRCHRSSQ